MYLILSGKSWNYFSIQFESVLSLMTQKKGEGGGSVINWESNELKWNYGRRLDRENNFAVE